MFTVLGATGNTGAVVARTLLDHGQAVRVLVRDAGKAAALRAAGAEVVVGDVHDVASLTAAFTGATGAYVLVPPAPTVEDMRGNTRQVVDNIATALAAAKVPHVVQLSSVAAHLPSGTGPIIAAHDAEQRLRQLPSTRLTFLRAASFMDNLGNYAHPMKSDGVLPVFGGGERHPFAMVSTRDIGRVAAEALLAPPPSQLDIIELSGPAEYSMVDAATAASAVLGRKVAATVVPFDALVPALRQMGMSAAFAGAYEEMTKALGTGIIRFDGSGRAMRGTVTLHAALQQLLA